MKQGGKGALTNSSGLMSAYSEIEYFGLGVTSRPNRQYFSVITILHTEQTSPHTPERYMTKNSTLSIYNALYYYIYFFFLIFLQV